MAIQMKSRILILISGVLSAQVITVLTMPIVSRLYTPEDIGTISLFITFFSMASAVAAFRYDSVVLVADTNTDITLAFQVGTALTIISSFIASLLLYTLIYQQVGGFSSLPLWAAVAIGGCVFFEAVFLILRSVFLRIDKIRLIRNATVYRSVFYAVSRIILGLASLGIVGLIAAEIIRLFSSFIVLLKSIKTSNFNFFEIEKSKMKPFVNKYIDFQKFEMPSILLNQIGLALPVIFISSIYGVKEAGYFAFAKLIVGIPSSQVGKSFSDIYQVELAKMHRLENYSQLKDLFFNSLKKLSLWGAAVFLVIMLLSKPVIPFVFGETWSEMAIVCVLISPWLYGAFVVGALSRTLIILRAQKLKLIYDLLLVCSFMSVYFYSKGENIEFYPFIMLISFVGFIVYVVYLYLIYRVINKTCQVK
jgi:O-antigen/teichoic acid export membrane protein